MLFVGELDGGPGRHGMVYFGEASIDAYLEGHGFGVVADPSTGSSTGSAETADGEGALDDTAKSRKPSLEARSDTGPHRPSGTSERS